MRVILTTTLFALALPMMGCESKTKPSAEAPAATARTEESTKRNLADRLDALESEWIRLKAKASGASALEADLRALRNDIEQSVQNARSALEALGNGISEEERRAAGVIQSRIEEIDRNIDSFRQRVDNNDSTQDTRNQDATNPSVNDTNSSATP